jgi:hypothetical protein
VALLVDGPACGIGDLVDQDAGLLETALNCGINVTTKLRLAAQEIQNDLQAWLDRPKFYTGWFPGFPGTNWRIQQVVVTPVIQQWQVMRTLSLVYRDAYFSQLVDRYQGKWNEFARLARAAEEDVVAAGLGMVNDPVAQALPPLLGTIGGPQQGGSFYASIAWLNAAGQAGAASAAAGLAVDDGNLMTVSGTQAPANAAGFNVYIGGSLDSLYLQNDVPLPVGDPYLYAPSVAKQSGPIAGQGQAPDFTRQLARTILRG